MHIWKEPTCDTPVICEGCNLTIGDATGHKWEIATCAQPMHCTVCGKTEGEPLEHTWTEATCESPQKCSVCGQTEGECADHDFIWRVATIPTYQTLGLLYGTCSVCGETSQQDIPALDSSAPGHWTDNPAIAPGPTPAAEIVADPNATPVPEQPTDDVIIVPDLNDPNGQIITIPEGADTSALTEQADVQQSSPETQQAQEMPQ